MASRRTAAATQHTAGPQKTLEIPIPNLEFDLLNPRIEEQHSQIQALAAVVRKLGEKIVNLAEDIVDVGLDPSSLPIVIPASGPNRFNVVEGNRRLAALRLLRNPDLAAGLLDRASEKRLRALSDRFANNPITKISCVVVAERGDANHWIELRHRGEQHGRGIVAWGGLEATRFEQRQGRNSRSAAAYDAIYLVRTRGGLDAATLEKLPKVPITTVQRLLNDPDVRVRLGMELEQGHLKAVVPEAELLKGLRRIISDAAHGKLKVSRVDTKALRATYIDEFEPHQLPSRHAKRSNTEQPPLPSTAPRTLHPPGRVAPAGGRTLRLRPEKQPFRRHARS